MNIYYVYFYLRKNFTPYYIGKGKNKRAHLKGKNEIKPPKDPSKIILVEQDLTELQAFILERYYIRWFGRKDNGTGILRNKTDGGEGVSGLKCSDKTRKKMSDSRKGISLSKKTKQKISIARTGIPRSMKTKQKISIGNSGKTRTKEHKEYLSFIHTGKIHSIETKLKMSKPKEKISCPYCGKIGGISSMKQYHFENCKQNKNNIIMYVTCPYCGLIGRDHINMRRYHFDNCKSKPIA